MFSPVFIQIISVWREWHSHFDTWKCNAICRYTHNSLYLIFEWSKRPSFYSTADQFLQSTIELHPIRGSKQKWDRFPWSNYPTMTPFVPLNKIPRFLRASNAIVYNNNGRILVTLLFNIVRRVIHSILQNISFKFNGFSLSNIF